MAPDSFSFRAQRMGRVKRISNKDLAEAFRAIGSRPIAASKIRMSLQDWKSLTYVECEFCGGPRHPDRPHSPEDCDLWRVQSVMEG